MNHEEGKMFAKVRKMAERRKLRQWQRELTELSERTGVSLEDVCRYIGHSYNRDIGIYVKIPKKRRTIIGIGMAYRQPAEVINRWINYYGLKRRLYSKDVTEDLIWLYLIGRNIQDETGGVNYFERYDECQQAAFETYLSIWNEVTAGSRSTADVDEQIQQIAASEEVSSIKDFVIDNIDSFKTAFVKPRKMLAKYVDAILEANGRASGKSGRDSLISLRGWLDDSMINYLSGSVSTINVTDMNTGHRIADIKQVPRSRKSHISLALALGMTRDDLDHYLDLMGYMQLSEDVPGEDVLIKELDKWDEEHPLQRAFKEKYIEGNNEIEMDPEDEQRAVTDMLMLRQDLRERYKRKKLKFEFMKS